MPLCLHTHLPHCLSSPSLSLLPKNEEETKVLPEVLSALAKAVLVAKLSLRVTCGFSCSVPTPPPHRVLSAHRCVSCRRCRPAVPCGFHGCWWRRAVPRPPPPAAACHSFNEESGGLLPDISIKNLLWSLRTLGLPLRSPHVLDPRSLEFL